MQQFPKDFKFYNNTKVDDFSKQVKWEDTEIGQKEIQRCCNSERKRLYELINTALLKYENNGDPASVTFNIAPDESSNIRKPVCLTISKELAERFHLQSYNYDDNSSPADVDKTVGKVSREYKIYFEKKI